MNKTKYSDDPKTFFFFVFVECISFDLSRQTVFHRLCTAQNADTALNDDCCCDKHTHGHMYIYIYMMQSAYVAQTTIPRSEGEMKKRDQHDKCDAMQYNICLQSGSGSNR